MERALTWNSGSFVGPVFKMSADIQPYTREREVVAIGIAAVMHDRRLNESHKAQA